MNALLMLLRMKPAVIYLILSINFSHMLLSELVEVASLGLWDIN